MEGHFSIRFTSLCVLATLITLLVFGFDPKMCHAARMQHNEKATTRFIKSYCGNTTYPGLCFDSLSVYSSAIETSSTQLAQTALSVSLISARSTSAMVSRMLKSRGMKPREAAAVNDCIVNMADSVDELQRSLEAMGHIKRKDLGLQIDNIETWVSAALTDENTCMDGFTDPGMNGGIKKSIRGHIVKVARLTSNALALINGIASTHSTSP